MARILHTDDSSDILEGIAGMLKYEGLHEVVSVTTVKDALELLDTQSFDLEIWDGSITPGQICDGARIAVSRKKLRKNVLILSADSEAEELALANDVPFVHKLHTENLPEVVAKLIGKK